MKARCIDNLKGQLSLKEGKEYDIINMLETNGKVVSYKVKNDMGFVQYYPKEHFKLVKEDKQQIKIQCCECACKPICSEVENWKKYCKEHIELRKKSVLFDEDPNCRYYIDKKVLEKKDEIKEVEVKKIDVDEKILDKLKKQPLIYTRPDKDIFNDDLSWRFGNTKLNHVAEEETCRKLKLNQEDFTKMLARILGGQRC